jgi:hypothetical protein
LDLDLYDYPAYAYGIFHAAMQARALGLRAITVMELGVGSGRGLLAMDFLAGEVKGSLGVAVTPVGFDTGRGLPAPTDYRDLPYLYRGGYYTMDEQLLRSELRTGRLILGDVRDTVRPFLSSLADAPVGFISFDLDYYSSTRDALTTLNGVVDDSPGCYLPRVLCYFDDIANADAMQSAHTGELLAVAECNAQSVNSKIAPIRGLAWSRTIPAPWNDQMFAWHYFDHPLYTAHVTEGAGLYVPPL